MSIWLLLVAIVPGLVISYYIFHIDKYERESFTPLVICFLLGILVTFPALWAQEYLDSLGFDEVGSLLRTFVYALVGVALVEELGKFICLTAYPYHRPFFNEPLDGIVYSVMIGMGFATFENILYAQSFGIETILVRAVTAVPAHGAFGVIMGYFVGLARFDAERKYWLLFQGLLFTITLHAIYDFFLLQQQYEGLMGLALLCLYLGIKLSRKLIRLHLEASPFQREEVNDKIDNEEI
ncbi:MAG: RsiW-degrading membrane proteinase PrsW (M82 family) [Saprospiraceae bacterium]|jgi:RsiW-degrading membrane proteinase PrsW (M82 family)